MESPFPKIPILLEFRYLLIKTSGGKILKYHRLSGLIVGGYIPLMAQQDIHNNQPDRLLTLNEAADYMNVGYRTIHRWIGSHKLPVCRLSMRALRIRRSDIESFINPNIAKI